MTKTLKTLCYIFCVSVLLFGFGACASKPAPKPEPKPELAKPIEPVKPAEPEKPIEPEEPIEPVKNENQEKAERLLDELAKARAEAIKAKADKAYPAQFKSADTTADSAKKSYESKNFTAAQTKAQKAIAQYRTLVNRTKIDSVKDTIDKEELSTYDSESYGKAEELSAKIPNLYTSDPAKAFETSNQALNYYETVKNAGLISRVNDAKKKADEARELADSVKAATAMKEPYTKTVNRYRAAGVAAGSKKYEKAYTGYMTAADEFNDIYEKVKVKRAQASEAMERAKARQDASSKLAKDADIEAPLPENAEGFSEEPVDLDELQRSTTTGTTAPAGSGS